MLSALVMIARVKRAFLHLVKRGTAEKGKTLIKVHVNNSDKN